MLFEDEITTPAEETPAEVPAEATSAAEEPAVSPEEPAA